MGGGHCTAEAQACVTRISMTSSPDIGGHCSGAGGLSKPQVAKVRQLVALALIDYARYLRRACRSLTIRDSRPVMIPTSIFPSSRTAFRPKPSRVWKVFSSLALIARCYRYGHQARRRRRIPAGECWRPAADHLPAPGHTGCPTVWLSCVIRRQYGLHRCVDAKWTTCIVQHHQTFVDLAALHQLHRFGCEHVSAYGSHSVVGGSPAIRRGVQVEAPDPESDAGHHR